MRRSRALAVVMLLASVILLPVGFTPHASASTIYIEISAGGNHTCALVSGGAVKCWGENWAGQLGNGTTDESSLPVDVSGLTGATQIAAGYDHACALVAGGAVKCWGYNWYGQLGNGTTDESSSLPVYVSGLTGATQISAEYYHTCAMVAGEAVKCWGANWAGQLGDGTTDESSLPVDVSGLTGATQISTGNTHTCALVAGGSAKCWGDNYWGQLGDGTWTDSQVPVDVSGLTGATQIAAGDGYTCALLDGGSVKCWGDSNDMQVGHLTGISGATQIALDGEHACALITGGSVKCWGYNLYGELGNGIRTDSPKPVDVSGLTGAIQIDLGHYYSCALLSGGSAKCWGRDNYGQLGNGIRSHSSLIPVYVADAGTILSIKAPGKVPRSTRARITGELSSSDTSCLNTQQVTLQKGRADVRTKTTSTEGKYRFALRVKSRTTVRVTFASTPTCGASRSVKKTIRVR